MGDRKSIGDFTKAAINTATDPGVLFSAGNTALMMPIDATACMTNAGVTGLCVVIRGIGELQNMDVKIPIPESLDTLVKNPGNAMATAGLITLCSAGATASNIDLTAPETAVPTAIMTCFGATGILRGMAGVFQNGSIQQRMMDFSGIMTAVTGYTLSNPDAPLVAQASYFIAGAMAIYLASRNQTPNGIVQPDLTFATANFANASYSTTPESTAANILWGLGCTSVDIMKKRGGIFVAQQDDRRQDYAITAHYSAHHGVDFEMDTHDLEPLPAYSPAV